jgi:hypothetical protein
MKNFIVLGSLIIVVVAVGAVLVYVSSPSLTSGVNNAIYNSINATTTIPYTIVASGTSADSINERTNYEITSGTDLATLWALVYGQSDNVPSIDFTKYEVLAVFDGSHSTQGYSIQVTSVTDANGERMVVVTHSKPADGCTPSVSPTNPFELVQVPKTILPLQHQDVTTLIPCS